MAVANDLCNCFHLLFLLEEQIAEKFGKKYNMPRFEAEESLIRLAHGEYPKNCRDKSYGTRFMECNYSCANHAESEKDDILSLIWGEMSPYAIPCIDGYAVIVLLETNVSRGFDAQFLSVPHTALNPYVKIDRELTDSEYRMWIDKIKEKLEQ